MAMSRRIACELRQLREIAHYFLTQHVCEFCGMALEDIEVVGELDLGHSTPKPLTVDITFQHDDGHPEGNKPGKRNNTHQNLKPSHRKCHKRYELMLRHRLTKEGINASSTEQFRNIQVQVLARCREIARDESKAAR